jgi:hypothetical protein
MTTVCGADCATIRPAALSGQAERNVVLDAVEDACVHGAKETSKGSTSAYPERTGKRS